MAKKEFYTENKMNKFKKEKVQEKQLVKVKLKEVGKTVIEKKEPSKEIYVINPVGE